jgi:hypothetical protein
VANASKLCNTHTRCSKPASAAGTDPAHTYQVQQQMVSASIANTHHSKHRTLKNQKSTPALPHLLQKARSSSLSSLSRSLLGGRWPSSSAMSLAQQQQAMQLRKQLVNSQLISDISRCGRGTCMYSIEFVQRLPAHECPLTQHVGLTQHTRVAGHRMVALAKYVGYCCAHAASPYPQACRACVTIAWCMRRHLAAHLLAALELRPTYT